MYLQHKLHRMLAVCALASGFSLQTVAQQVADSLRQDTAVVTQAVVTQAEAADTTVKAVAGKEAKASKRKRRKTDDKAVQADSAVITQSVKSSGVPTDSTQGDKKKRKQKEPKAEKKEPPFSFNFQAVEDYWELQRRIKEYQDVEANKWRPRTIIPIDLDTVAAKDSLGAVYYMLGRPNIAKHFANKGWAEHLYFEGGFGVNFMATRMIHQFGAQGEAALGKWFTPEHGARLTIKGGRYRMVEQRTRFVGIGLDYTLNLHSVARPDYMKPRRFEMHGVFGADVSVSNSHGNRDFGFGVHVGLRSQVKLMRYNYLYVEPRVGVLSNGVTQLPTWHQMRPYAEIMAGLGFRRMEQEERSFDQTFSKKFFENWFLSTAAGPAFVVNALPGSWKNNRGVLGYLGVGKWFDRYNGLRLGMYGGRTERGGFQRVPERPYEQRFLRYVAGELDYMFNLSNFFAGYRNDRRVSFNALAGLELKHFHNNYFNDTELGYVGGIQANVRLMQGLDFYVEPRLELYKTGATPGINTSRYEVATSMLAGLTINSDFRKGFDLRRSPDEFERKSWRDNMFLEIAGGTGWVGSRTVFQHPFDYLGYVAHLGFGQWFTSLHGARVWGRFGQYQTGSVDKFRSITVGADYMFHVTNSFLGVRHKRWFDLYALLGLGMSKRTNYGSKGAPYFMVQGGLQAEAHITKMLSVYVEPQIRIYNSHFAPNPMERSVDPVADLLAGIKVNMRGAETEHDRPLYQEHGHRSYISVAGGMYAPARYLGDKSWYAPTARLSYVSWFNPYSAWRANLKASSIIGSAHRYCEGSVGGDLLTDLTAHTLGYNPERLVNVIALGGFNVGGDYTVEGDKNALFDLHVGAQLSFRVSPNVNVYLEGQLPYRFTQRIGERRERLAPTAMLGIDYGFQRVKRSERQFSDVERKNFVQTGIGVGLYTGNINTINPIKRKLTLPADLCYGRWFGNVHGIRGGYSRTAVQRSGKGNSVNNIVHIEYITNIRAALTGESTEHKLFQLTTAVGPIYTINRRYNWWPTMKGFGFQASMQLGCRVSRLIEVYFEPQASISSKKIEFETTHPAEGEVHLMLGTKFYF